jgi:thiol:disulfide interchange protein
VQEIKMKLNRRIWMLSLALAVAVSGVCFSQVALQADSKKKVIYSESANAHAEIKEALEKATAEHKRVIVVFGANWCYDCHVLDTAFHRSDLAPILSANYEVVHVDIGKGEKNQDLMKKYEVPMKRGIPGLAVLDADGKLVYSQKNGEFENARALAPEDFLAFLNKWKPAAQSR